VSKKCSDLSFSLSSAGGEPDIVLSDKVGDVYLYPLTPRPVSGDRPAPLALNSDPTLNPDADLLLGHVSVLTAAVLSYDGKSIITSDRDEHIRVSRFPKSYIIERYLFGSDGFISALHVPEGSPSTLISAGGEQWMRIWNWETGEALGKVDIYPAVLPHRRARSNLRRVKRKRNAAQAEVEAGGEAGSSGQAEAPKSDLAAGSFYAAPEGYALPSGQGVCIKKIRTVKVGDQTMVLFFSEG
jgi:tRNA (guanine-N(7)-)-methyltransferase subunit TRM82